MGKYIRQIEKMYRFLCEKTYHMVFCNYLINIILRRVIRNFYITSFGLCFN